MEYIAAWVIFAGVVGMIASSRGRGFGGFFMLSLVISPLLGLVVLLASGDGTRRAPCWQCKEAVVVGASKCPHCGAALVWNQPAAS